MTLHDRFRGYLHEVFDSRPRPGEPLLEINVSDAELSRIFDPVRDYQIPFVEVIEDDLTVGETEDCVGADGQPTVESCFRPRWNQRFLFPASGARFYRFKVCIEHFLRVRTMVGECGFAAADAWATAASMPGPVALSCQIIFKGEVTGTLNLVLSMHDAAHEALAMQHALTAHHKALQKEDDDMHPDARAKQAKREVLSKFYEYKWDKKEDLVKEGFGSALYLAHPLRGNDVYRLHDEVNIMELPPAISKEEHTMAAIEAVRGEPQTDVGLGKNMSWEIGVDDVEDEDDDSDDDGEAYQPDLLSNVFQEALLGEAYNAEDFVEFDADEGFEAHYPRSSEKDSPLVVAEAPSALPTKAPVRDSLPRSYDPPVAASRTLPPSYEAPVAAYDLALPPQPAAATPLIADSRPYAQVQYPLPSAGPGLPGVAASMGPLAYSAGTAPSMASPVFSGGLPAPGLTGMSTSMGPTVFSAGSLSMGSAAQLPGMRLPTSSAPVGAFRAYPTQVSEEQRRRQRELAADRAQLRQEQSLARGIGDVQKAKEMQERAHKETLLGRIEEHYARMKEEMPFFLRMAPLEGLQQHMKTLQGRTPYSNTSVVYA
mmetsp:Transcript_32676/g.56859  ORF Transcript_32676/g.56859 Transcript_32676/m.56859 type:complete len:598 (+) Transcript_32676:88-1881(+)